ncbi:GH19650 [Drosophila grimshawi]|uniref:GH19650 n=1 Tax=Drosophila grimshawi TaxID=7222 RepID=B4K2A1_DROGR|nr:GH19650 [Drosophila grimshawi]
MQMLNVLALFEDYRTTNTFYSYNQFPTFQLEQRIYKPSLPIYPDRLNNLYGYHVSIMIGGASPRIIIYYNKQGGIVYKGTIGHFIDAFQQRYNCTFTQPRVAKPNMLVASTDLVVAVLNGTVDIGMAVTFPYLLNMRTFTYPYEQLNWCLMLPIEPDIPPAMYYLNVFQLDSFLLTLAVLVVISITLSLLLKHNGYDVQLYEFILHDNCLRGALGQSFHELRNVSIQVRSIYIQICILGFLLTAWYNSYFSAYVTSTPKELPYQSYDDILASNVKIVAWEPEYYELIGRVAEFRKYERMFHIERSLDKFISMRDSLNTKFGYAMTESRWVVINEQQNIFSKPLFRMRDDFCFFKNIPLGFPVRENSVYKQPLQKLILELSEMGLYSYWMSKGYSELVDAGEMKFLDLSGRREFRAMQLQDLQYVWYGFAFMMVFSSSVWLLELFTNWLTRRNHNRTQDLPN